MAPRAGDARRGPRWAAAARASCHRALEVATGAAAPCCATSRRGSTRSLTVLDAAADRARGRPRARRLPPRPGADRARRLPHRRLRGRAAQHPEERRAHRHGAARRRLDAPLASTTSPAARSPRRAANGGPLEHVGLDLDGWIGRRASASSRPTGRACWNGACGSTSTRTCCAPSRSTRSCTSSPTPRRTCRPGCRRRPRGCAACSTRRGVTEDRVEQLREDIAPGLRRKRCSTPTRRRRTSPVDRRSTGGIAFSGLGSSRYAPMTAAAEARRPASALGRARVHPAPRRRPTTWSSWRSRRPDEHAKRWRRRAGFESAVA